MSLLSTWTPVTRAAEDVTHPTYRTGSDPGVISATGTRPDPLARELGDAFLRVELDGKGHSTVTAHRSQDALGGVLAPVGETLR
jgi:hypothetical protein